MITAKEAKELVEQSDEKMSRRLDQIGEKIKEAATLGKREIWLDMALPYHTEFAVAERPFYSAEFTPLQRLIEQKLKAFGYSMQIAKRETHIGGGLGSMDDEVKIEHLPYLQVRW